ncbi:MAG: hypothetical protein IJK49_07170 [Prevotella sp.]|nr:hypothetical protein [Prevotella sp.]
MKKLLLSILALVAIATGTKASVVLNSTNFPDPAFRVVISSLTGVEVGGTISDSQLASITSIDVSNRKITTLKGIEYFTQLVTLTCANNQLTSLDVSKNTKITRFYCQENKLTSLDVSKNTELYEFNCSDNQLTSLDVSKNTGMQRLICSNNPLSSLDVSKNIYLTELSCSSMNLTSLNVSSLSILSSLTCYRNQLTSLDLSKNTKLRSLNCFTNNLTSLDLTNNPDLDHLQCYNNQITSLDLTKNTALKSIFCQTNKLTTLDVTKCTLLETLYCYGNSLTTLKLSSSNSKLKTLDCHGNKLRSIDLSNKILLEDLRCFENNLTSLSLSDCELLDRLDCYDNELSSLNLSKNVKLTKLACQNNYLTHLELENNTFLTIADISPQTSTRRFQIMSSNGSTNNCWALYVGTTDASRIRDLYFEMTNKPVTLLSNNPGWLVVSDDLKKIPKYVWYQYDVKNSGISNPWIKVTVNYDIRNYGVYIAGEELTSLNFYDIPGLKSGTAYLMDEHEGIGWSGNAPTLVLNNAKIAGEKGIVNEDCYNLKIIASGDNEVTATDYIGFDNSGAAVKTVFSGGGTIRFTATGGSWHGIYAGDYTITELTEGTKVICKGDGYGYFDDCGRLYIKENSALMAYGNQNPSVELPKESDRHFDSNIAIRYPVGATYDDKYSVCYAGTTTKVQRDWVVIGPPGAVPPKNPYDLNGDDKVSTADIQVIINEMKKPQASQNMEYDLNNDGKISTADIQVIINEMKK